MQKIPTTVSGKSIILLRRCLVLESAFFSEKLFMEMADAMVKEGYRDSGYEYINIDVSGLLLAVVCCYDTYFTSATTPYCSFYLALSC